MSAIYYSYFQAPVGQLFLLANEEFLIRVEFELEKTETSPSWIREDNLPVLLATKQSLTRYFAGEKETFEHLAIAPSGTAFQQQVWQALRQIPYGKWTTYAELAMQIGNPKAVRAVGGAVGRNPLSIIIPCHRVLGKQQALTGFGGGLPAKRYLLQLENIDYMDKGIEFVKPKKVKI